MAIISFSAPAAADRGKCFSVSIPAFSRATPSEAARYLLNAGPTQSIIRYTWATVAAVATVIEGLIERITIPYQLSGLGLTDNLKRSDSASDTGAENLLRSAMSETLALIISRDRVADIERMTSLEHWLALAHDVFAAANSTSVRTLEVSNNVAVEVYPPLFRFFDFLFFDQWQPYQDAIEPFDGSQRSFWGYTMWQYNSSNAWYLDSSWIGAVNDAWNPAAFVAAVGGSTARTLPDSIQRFNLDLLWALQGALGCMLAQQARVPVRWQHPHTTTTTTYEYTVDVDGNVSSPTVTTETSTETLSTISCERKITAETSGTWTDERGDIYFYAECEIGVALTNPDPDGASYRAMDIDDLPDVDLSEIDAEIATLQAAFDAAKAEYDAADTEYNRRKASADALYTNLVNRILATNAVQSALNPRDINPLNTKQYEPLWYAGDPDAGWANQEATILYNAGPYHTYAYFPMSDIDAEDPGFSTDYGTFHDAYLATNAAREARRQKEPALHSAGEALWNAKYRRDQLIDQADLEVDADIYDLTPGVYPAGYYWDVEFYDEDPFDTEHAPTSITLRIVATLRIPTGSGSAVVTEAWPSAAAFAGGYVKKQRLAAADRFDDNVRLYQAVTDEDDRTTWQASRNEPANPTMWRFTLRESAANPSASVASALGTQIARAAEAHAQTHITAAFDLPTPVGITSSAWSQPERASTISASMDSLRSVKLVYNRYRSTKLRDSSFAGWQSDEGDLFLPYRIVCNGSVIWEYDSPKVVFDGSFNYSAHSQHASAPTFSEGFDMEHSQHASIGVEWAWKSMPCAATS